MRIGLLVKNYGQSHYLRHLISERPYKTSISLSIYSLQLVVVFCLFKKQANRTENQQQNNLVCWGTFSFTVSKIKLNKLYHLYQRHGRFSSRFLSWQHQKELPKWTHFEALSVYPTIAWYS